jgi:hypothetical protein
MIQMTHMAQMVRCCPDCRSDQPFEQYHDDPGCPDSPDGHCPEWSCTACGAALFLGSLPYVDESTRVDGPSRVYGSSRVDRSSKVYESSRAPDIRDRVA